MKVSIITSVYNNKSTIAGTIESVLSQTYSDIEYIVVDGASTDGTLEIIEKYSDKIDKILSEPDRGIYEGLNKGLALATGDVIGFLHSDDIFYSADVIEKVVKKFEESGVDSVYGDLIYVSKENTDIIIRYWKAGQYNKSKIAWGWFPPHTAWFVKKNIYDQYGNFDTQFKISADLDLMLRFLYISHIKAAYLKAPLIKMRVGGASNNSLLNLLKKLREDYRAVKKNKIKAACLVVFLKKIRKIPQYFQRRG